MENEILQLKIEIEELKKELERFKQHTHTGLDGSKKLEYIDLPERGVIYFGRGVSLQGPAAGVKDPSDKRGKLLITGDFKPYSTSLNLNLGDPNRKWNYYYGNITGCDLPVKNSAINVFKKLPKVVIKKGHYGKGQYLEEDKMPDEFRYEDKNTGKKPISGWHTLGLCVQAIRELIEKIENLEQRLNDLESKNA